MGPKIIDYEKCPDYQAERPVTRVTVTQTEGLTTRASSRIPARNWLLWPRLEDNTRFSIRREREKKNTPSLFPSSGRLVLKQSEFVKERVVSEDKSSSLSLLIQMAVWCARSPSHVEVIC